MRAKETMVQGLPGCETLRRINRKYAFQKILEFHKEARFRCQDILFCVSEGRAT